MNVDRVPPTDAHIVANAAWRRAAEAAAGAARDFRMDATRDVASPGGSAAAPAAKGAPEVRATHDAPRGASLWELLTPEERAFFADPGALASLTYRPGGRGRSLPGGPTGQRVDVEA